MILAKGRLYYRNNLDKSQARNARRRARKLDANVTWVNEEKIKDLYKQAARFSLWLGIKYHVDHIIPLAGNTVCGLHVENNLQIIPSRENLSKSNKFNANDFNEVQTKERQQMNKYFDEVTLSGGTNDDTGHGDVPPQKPPTTPTGG